MFEKWWVADEGLILNCCEASDANSRAINSPTIVTVRAAILRTKGIVIRGVLRGGILAVMSSPAKILPQASRLMGFMTVRLFSLIGETGLNRGWPMETKNTTRRL